MIINYKVAIVLLLFSQLIFAKKVQTTVECALVYRILHFVELPQRNQYTLCVDSTTEEFDIFKKQLNGKELNYKKMSIIRATQSILKDCDLVYLGQSARLRNEQIHKEMEKKSLLVFSTTDDRKDISLVSFAIESNKVVFRVNKTLINKYNFHVSSKVLRLASELY